MNPYQQWNALTEEERAYFRQHPLDLYTVRQAREEAFAETSRRFGFNGHNDRSDAFRHCYWSAILASELGYSRALRFTNAHEASPMNPASERRMDLHNNQIGLNLGRHGGTYEQLSNRCFQASRSGQLLVLR